MKRPILDEYDREFLHHHREGRPNLYGALKELDLAVLRLRRELWRVVLDTHKFLKGDK